MAASVIFRVIRIVNPLISSLPTKDKSVGDEDNFRAEAWQRSGPTNLLYSPTFRLVHLRLRNKSCSVDRDLVQNNGMNDNGDGDEL